MIQGENVFIRQLELGDEEYLHKWWNSKEVMGHIGYEYGYLKSREAIRQKILADIESQEIFPKEKLFIIIRRENKKPIGEISYYDFDSRNQKCKFNIKICDPADQGKGYGKDALYNFVDFLFKFLNLNKVDLKVLADNERGKRLYKSIGFKEIGYIRKDCFDSRSGEFVDILYMDLLKEDWIKIRGN